MGAAVCNMGKKLVSLYFIGALAVFMVSIPLRFFCQNVLIERFNMVESPFVKAVMFDMPIGNIFIQSDGAALYPFQQTAAHGNTASGTAARKNAIFALLGKAQQRIHTFSAGIENVKTKITKYATTILFNYGIFAEYAVYIERAFEWRIYNGDVIDLGGGYITEVNKKINDNIYLNYESISNFNEYLQSEYIDFLYIQLPHKISEADAESVKDFNNQNASALLSGLSALGVPALDLRQVLLENGLDHHALFYKTDHHWKAETGLWAAEIIAEFLNTEYGYGLNIELLQPNMWRRDIFEKIFLGSTGRKVTLALADPEDISIFYPNFETLYTLSIPSRNADTEGPFNIFYDYSMLQKQNKKSAFYNIIPYNAYSFGDHPVVSIHNKIPGGSKKILVIKDSFGSVCVPFLSAVFENIDVLVLNYFTGSVKTFIRQTQPDMVIVMYNPGALGASNTKNEMFNFR